MLDRAHTSGLYDQKLRLLKDKLLLMSYHAERMIADSIRALVERRSSLAQDVILRDDTLDCLELEIDSLCNEILALHHPVAGDLRFVATAFKIVRDIERIGDIAVNIAKRAEEYLRDPSLNNLVWGDRPMPSPRRPPKAVYQNSGPVGPTLRKQLVSLPIMAHQAQRILAASLESFVNSDDKLAEQVIRDDASLDGLNEQIFRELLTYMMEDGENVPRCLKLIFIGRHLERVGDHATNIAEMVLFMIRAKDSRRSATTSSQS